MNLTNKMSVNMSTPHLSVNTLIHIELEEELELPCHEEPGKSVFVKPPTSAARGNYVNIRLLSEHIRDGMVNESE